MFYAYPLIQILIMALVMCAMIIIRLFWRTSSNTYYILSEFLLFSFMIIFLMIILILIYIIYMTLTLRLLLLLDIVHIYMYINISLFRVEGCFRCSLFDCGSFSVVLITKFFFRFSYFYTRIQCHVRHSNAQLTTITTGFDGKRESEKERKTPWNNLIAILIYLLEERNDSSFAQMTTND